MANSWLGRMTDEYASFTKARVLIKLDRLGEARQALEETARKFPGNVQIDVLGGRLAEKAGDPTEALTRWDAVLAQHPEHEEANQSRVRVLLRLGQIDAARAHARRIPGRGRHVAARQRTA